VKEKLVEALDALEAARMPDWAWSSLLLVVGLLSVLVSVVFYPSEDPNWTMILGRQFGGECGFQMAFGLPCPSCGMTRSWVWLVRGEIGKAFAYNAAGAMLLLWLALGGFLGALRLVTRNYKLLVVPFPALFWWTMFWLAGPYLGMWVARCFGINPL
jgi:hypothetical protein